MNNQPDSVIASGFSGARCLAIKTCNMNEEELKAYEQSDQWIDQVNAAHTAFHERTENGLLAIEYLIHDLERIKAGEIVFI